MSKTFILSKKNCLHNINSIFHLKECVFSVTLISRNVNSIKIIQFRFHQWKYSWKKKIILIFKIHQMIMNL